MFGVVRLWQRCAEGLELDHPAVEQLGSTRILEIGHAQSHPGNTTIVFLCWMDRCNTCTVSCVLSNAVHLFSHCFIAAAVPCQSYGPAAAATSAAVACFMASLAHHQQLQHLELAFKCDDYYSILRQGGGALDRMPGLWGKVLRTAADAMKVYGLEGCTGLV